MSKKDEREIIQKIKSLSESEVANQKLVLLDELTKDRSADYKELARTFLEVYGDYPGFLKPGTFKKTLLEIDNASIYDLVTDKVIQANPQKVFEIICRSLQSELKYDELKPEFEIYQNAVIEKIAKVDNENGTPFEANIDDSKLIEECKELKKIWTKISEPEQKIEFLADRISKISVNRTVDFFVSLIGRGEIVIGRTREEPYDPPQDITLTFNEKLDILKKTNLPAYLEKFPSNEQLQNNPEALKGAVLEIALEIKSTIEKECPSDRRYFTLENKLSAVLRSDPTIVEKINQVYTSPNFDFESPVGKVLAATLDNLLGTRDVENNELKVEFLNSMKHHSNGRDLDIYKLTELIKDNPDFLVIVESISPYLYKEVESCLIRDAADSIHTDYDIDYYKGKLFILNSIFDYKEVYDALENKDFYHRGISELFQGVEGIYRLAMEYRLDHLKEEPKLFKKESFEHLATPLEVVVLLALGVVPDNVEVLERIDGKTRGLIDGLAKVNDIIGEDLKISSKFKDKEQRESYLEMSLVGKEEFSTYSDERYGYKAKCREICDILVSTGRVELIEYVKDHTPLPELKEMLEDNLDKMEKSTEVDDTKDNDGVDTPEVKDDSRDEVAESDNE